MEKILITGATGFIGSHLTELCVEKGYEVVAFDKYNPNNNINTSIGLIYALKKIFVRKLVLHSLFDNNCTVKLRIGYEYQKVKNLFS
tara:strand:+ start:304 stop:564 length:261 start_codon:yes stop_codon:yes gene_type:complete